MGQFVAAIMLALAIGAALRVPQLDRRPMHGDEAVHAYKLEILRDTGAYHYDPHEYHGPTLYYSTLPVLWVSGVHSFGDMTETTLRIVPVLFGLGMILLLPLLNGGIPRSAIAVAAMLTAVSPALTFYSRYYIQETLLAFFTLALIGCGWRFVHTRRGGWAIAAGGFAGLMHATKETCIIAFACLLIALIATVFWSRRSSGGMAPFEWRRHAGSLAASVGAGVAVSFILLSGFLTNMTGPRDSIATYSTYLDRAGGGIHEQPWYYYLKILLYTSYRGGLIWSEGFILVLAALGAAVALQGARRRPVSGTDRRSRPCCSTSTGFARFLAIYSLLMVGTYSIIPYKTPWSMMEFLQPMIVLAGIATVAVVPSVQSLGRWLGSRSAAVAFRVAICSLLVAAMAHLGWQAHRAGFRFAGDYRNPYVYAQPLGDVIRLGDWIERLSFIHPDGIAMVTKVVAENPWPLPWYLRRLERVGYWDEDPPADVDAPVVIVSSTQQSVVEQRMRNKYHMSHYGLLPDVVLLVYVDQQLWQAFAESESSAEHDVGEVDR